MWLKLFGAVLLTHFSTDQNEVGFGVEALRGQNPYTVFVLTNLHSRAINGTR